MPPRIDIKGCDVSQGLMMALAWAPALSTGRPSSNSLQESSMAQEHLTVAEASKILGCTVQHTRLLIRRGKLAASKLGHDRVITQEAVAEYLARRQTVPMFDRQRSRRHSGGAGREPFT